MSKMVSIFGLIYVCFFDACTYMISILDFRWDWRENTRFLAFKSVLLTIAKKLFKLFKNSSGKDGMILVLLCVKYSGGRLAPRTPKPAVAGAPLLLAFAIARLRRANNKEFTLFVV